MKISVKTLRRLIKEEIQGLSVQEGPDDDRAAYEKIMQMITDVLGDSPETQEIGAKLSGAMAKTPEAGDTISMTSLTRPADKPDLSGGPNIKMRSMQR